MITQTPTSPAIDIPKLGMPVTIITGFLGSGKTTLLNHILQNQRGLKIAVLVNEFGDINIDSQLLVSSDENMMELSNGCICCTINDGLVETVYEVLEREDRVDYLVVETSGVADPLPLAITFVNTELRDMTRLDSILTVVDVETFSMESLESQSALNQVAYGDIVVLNKVDLVSPEKLKQVDTYIRTIKNGARILHCTQGQVPLSLILDVQLFSRQQELAELEQSSPLSDGESVLFSNHLQNDGFDFLSFKSDRPFELSKFEHFLTEQLPDNIYRAKAYSGLKKKLNASFFNSPGNATT